MLLVVMRTLHGEKKIAILLVVAGCMVYQNSIRPIFMLVNDFLVHTYLSCIYRLSVLHEIWHASPLLEDM